MAEGQSVFILLGAGNTMEHSEKVLMILTEVQTGAYLDEDGII